METAENAADMAIEKTKEAGQQLLEEGKSIAKKVGDYVTPEEVVKVGFSNAINQETPGVAQEINYFAVQHGQKQSNFDLPFSEQLHEKIGVDLSCDFSTLPPNDIAMNYVSACHYASHRFDNSQRICVASATDSLLQKGVELISGTVQTICETACEHKKALDNCVEAHNKTADLTPRQSDKLARQEINVENASAEYQCIDNDLVISELGKLRQLVTQCKNDKDCDVNSKAFKRHYADESQRILYFYDRGRANLYETYEDNNFVDEHNTNSLFKTRNVSRALITTGIKRREPVDNTCIPASNKITFFTEINNYAYHRVTHRWKYNNKTKFELSFNVRGPRWRVWTTKNIYTKWVGPWVIEVVDEDGKILTQKLLYYFP